jgi:peptidoglycan/LPS O-acetylase OafA/YrhL
MARSLGDAFRSAGSDRSNNFLLLRLIAASLVIYGHSFVLTRAACPQCQDFVQGVLRYRYAGDLGVAIFFVISGFLVSASFVKHPHLSTFIASRAARLFPGLLVFVGIVTLILGPIVSTLPSSAYFAERETWDFLRINGTLLGFQPGLPGVLAGSTFPSPAGTLWTLWIEGRFYLLTGAAGAFGILGKPSAPLLVTLLGTIIALFAPAYFPLIGATVQGTWLAAFFGIGAILLVWAEHIPLDGRIVALLVLIAFLSSNLPSYELACGAAIAYGALWVAFSPKIPMPPFVRDYSYGMYLYGWPAQQLILLRFPGIGPYKLFALSWLAAVGLGALSWFVVERPMLDWWHRVRRRAEAS